MRQTGKGSSQSFRQVTPAKSLTGRTEPVLVPFLGDRFSLALMSCDDMISNVEKY